MTKTPITVQDLRRRIYLKAKADIPIYGRRRVGKSELILHFIKGKPALYFLGKKAPPQLQIRTFMEEAARALDQPLLAAVSPLDWRMALSSVLGQKTDAAKLVLVFDEFQWTAQASPELPSILQEQLDRSWKERGDVMLILCGSYMGFFSYMGFIERKCSGRRVRCSAGAAPDPPETVLVPRSGPLPSRLVLE